MAACRYDLLGDGVPPSIWPFSGTSFCSCMVTWTKLPMGYTQELYWWLSASITTTAKPLKCSVSEWVCTAFCILQVTKKHAPRGIDVSSNETWVDLMGSFSDLQEQQSDHSDNVEVFYAYIVAKSLLKQKEHLRESNVGIKVAQSANNCSLWRMHSGSSTIQYCRTHIY